MTPEINLGEYQLFDKGYKVYHYHNPFRALVQDPNGEWFIAVRLGGTQFSSVPRGGKQTVFGSLRNIEDHCAKFKTPNAAISALDWML